MAILRRALYLDALVAGVVGLALAAAPRAVVERMLAQAAVGDDAWLRLAGVASMTLALLMVLVGHRAEELWWWAWAFVVLEAGTASVATLHALLGLPAGSAAWPWWVLAAGSWAFAFAFLWGLARADSERPPL